MKTKILIPVAVLALLMSAAPALAELDLMKLPGRILLRVERLGEAYYMVNSEHAEYMGRPFDALIVMRRFGVGITNADLTKIQVADMNLGTTKDSDGDGLSDKVELTFGTDPKKPDTDGDGYKDKLEITSGYSPLSKDTTPIVNSAFANLHKGKIFLQVESWGEAWYVNPNDGKRYFLGTPDDAFAVMRKLGMGISEADFDLIPVVEQDNNFYE
jgi:hypothetical protein